jgi:hypothetical protein
MECMIEVIEQSDHRVIRLAGRLSEAQVPDLFNVCAAPATSVRLDLGNLISVDLVGLDALHRLQQRGTVFTDVPEYIQLKLNALTGRRRT